MIDPAGISHSLLLRGFPLTETERQYIGFYGLKKDGKERYQSVHSNCILSDRNIFFSFYFSIYFQKYLVYVYIISSLKNHNVDKE